MWDDNGSYIGWEVIEDIIKEFLISMILVEKDKVLENVNNGNNGVKLMDISYILMVIDVCLVGEDIIIEDV